MASLFLPVVLMAPMLWFDFSYPLLALLISVIGLLIFRMTILFRLVACCHCYMKTSCPNAKAMGIR
jgi:TRAP-type C4-dicarboxylate transport system permease small subunit